MAIDTVQSLYYKPDWPQAKQRIAACWERLITDRPGLDIKASRPTDLPAVPKPERLEDIFLDPEYVAAVWRRMFESTWFLGEAVPAGPILMAGYALGCGPNVRFAENTVWHPVTMSSLDGPLGWWPGPDDPWRAKLRRVVERLFQDAPGRFLVGHTGQVPVNDLLMLLRGANEFLVELAEDPAKCRRRMDEMLPLWLENKLAIIEMVNAQQHAGCVYGWPGLWHPTFMATTQSDMSCMISAAMFEYYVMHELDVLGERFHFVWYHLDGPLAVRHLPTLLSRPYIQAIQWVPGDGQPRNGPVWLDLYRRVQAAGRCLDIDVPWDDMEFIIRHLRPEGLMLRTHAPSREAGEELLANAPRWCGSHVG